MGEFTQPKNTINLFTKARRYVMLSGKRKLYLAPSSVLLGVPKDIADQALSDKAVVEYDPDNMPAAKGEAYSARKITSR